MPAHRLLASKETVPMPAHRLLVSMFCMLLTADALAAASPQPVIEGELKLYHPITITFEGPATSETATPNPFTDYRLDVTFRQGERTVLVPGYWAGDGDAADTSADAGSKWRVHFTPDRIGRWEYTAGFRQGMWVAVAEHPKAGDRTSFHGAAGSFDIGPTDKRVPDFRARGLLQYVGHRYLQFSNGEYFVKGGADSPENVLGYYEFDATPPSHRFDAHAGDFREGDPTWAGGKGRNIIGALNYLGSRGVNSVYMLTMNVRGDGNDTWPWIDRKDHTRFDVSKLAQWEVVFSHMDSLGIMLHLVTQETENDQLLDDGELGPHRKLYYRELVARFGHHLGITWNLGEENTNTTGQLKAFARQLDGLDAYDHLIVVHTFPGSRQHQRVYEPLLGDEHLGGASMQNAMDSIGQRVARWVVASSAAGRPWVVSFDEQAPAGAGVKPDADDPQHDKPRRSLWQTLMAGGAGAEWYFGYGHAHHDIDCEDWRSRDRMWDLTRHALTFFKAHLPFDRMEPADSLAGEGQHCLARVGEVYALYLPQGGQGTLDLTGQEGRFEVGWYDPRAGGPLQAGSVTSVTGGAKADLGAAPSQGGQDWVVLVRKAQ